MKEGSLTTIAFLTMGSMSRQTTLPEREGGQEREGGNGESERERERGREGTAWLEWGPQWAGEIMS